jgi:hypothetical protein
MNLLKQREQTHGSFKDVARVAQRLKDEVWSSTIPDIHQESLDMICVKMSRIVNGDYNELDHWTDIIGYAQLVINHIKSVPPGSASIQEPDDDPHDDSRDYYIPRSGLPR